MHSRTAAVYVLTDMSAWLFRKLFQAGTTEGACRTEETLQPKKACMHSSRQNINLTLLYSDQNFNNYWPY